ncbi:TonB-dependent receptor [Phenylobacterium sp.]|uniref:TonB-dependent receptor n=1 Tax=Phenylobacterium sp. TaxID=1871053 RepID=UPI002ED9EE6F
MTAFSTEAFAQATEIEELVVTAEKREQSLQDVPVAVSAFTDERRELVGINSVQDLTNFTPGLSYSTNNDRASLRGIGRFSNNRSTEGGVAMYNDGFYTSSVTAFAQSTLFLERTEVLRGPQGTLYGKNAIGGALNIVSKRPTDDFYAEVRGTYGNYDTKVLEAAMSGPLFAGVRGRVAGSWSHIGKGVFENLNPNVPDEGNRGAYWTIEGQLDGEFADGKVEWWLKHSTTEWHTLGRGPGGRTTIAYGQRGGTTVPLQAPLTPNAAGFGLSTILPSATCQFCYDTDDGNYINLESNTTTLNVTFHADNFDVKYITGLTYYDYRLQTDLDGTSRSTPFLLPLPAVGGPVPRPAQSLPYFPRQHNQYQEEVWWFSNELNISSTHEGPLQWLFGAYQYREGSNYRLSDARFPDDARFERPVGQTGLPVALNPLRRYAVGEAENKNQSYAAFGQVDWQATETLKVTAGLRYTYDEKTSFEGARLFCLYTTACPISRLLVTAVDVTNTVVAPVSQLQYDPAVQGGTVAVDALGQEHRVGAVYTDPTTGLRHRLLNYDWSALTGTFGLDWKPDPDTLAYAKYSKGYKAGGFDSGTTTLQQFVTTEKETIDAFEVGLKKTFGGRLQTNISAFYYDYKDIQIPLSFFNEVVGANQTRFVNVPKARTYGLEVETVWQPIENLQILANYSYLNAEIRKGVFTPDPDDPLGVLPGVTLAPASAQAPTACIPGRTPVSAPGAPATCSLLTQVNQDIKGAKLPSSTPHRFTINANYTWEFDPGSLSLSANYVWRDATYYSIFNRYYNRAKSYGTTDMRAVFRDKDDRFTVIGSVKNVFDQRGSAGVSATRLSNTIAPPNSAQWNNVNQTISYILPRTYSLELQYRF